MWLQSRSTIRIQRNMKISKISSKLIKPHTQTPPNLKNYNLSFVDQFTGPLNFAVILCYVSKPERTNHFEESLARILVEFYPLAGRYIKKDHIVDCSDDGAEFIESEALDVELLDLVAKIETDHLHALLPDAYFRVDESADIPILSVQTTRFSCGGVAVAISVSHRVFDVSSLGTFVTAWSNASNPDGKADVITPSFDVPSLLPYKNLGHGDSSILPNMCYDGFVAKRFLFNKKALASLKLKIPIKTGDKTVSGVRVVCALIAKTLIRLDRAKHGHSRDWLIFQTINMRERTTTPQPKNSCGNFSFFSVTRRVATSEAASIGIDEIVDVIGTAVRKSISEYAEILSPNQDGQDIIINSLGNFMNEVFNPKMNVIAFSDWSKFGFSETDFGLGKPVWTSIGPMKPLFYNNTVLMSNREGEIEAWVNLDQNDMRYFEEDEEIKLFTT